MKLSAPSRNSRPMTKPPLETMLVKIENMLPHRKLPRRFAPWWAPTVVVLSLTVRVGVRMRRQGPSYGEVVHTSLRVQAPLGGGKSPMSQSPEAVDWNMGVCYKGCEPLSQRSGVANIECARTPSILHYRGSMYIKIGPY